MDAFSVMWVVFVAIISIGSCSFFYQLGVRRGWMACQDAYRDLDERVKARNKLHQKEGE